MVAQDPLTRTRYNQLPAPQLELTSTTPYETPDGHFTRYHLEIANASSYPDELFWTAPDLPACGLNSYASRMWVTVRDEYGRGLITFCGLQQPEDLNIIWFAVAQGAAVPAQVDVQLEDRWCNQTYTSNKIVVSPISNVIFLPGLKGSVLRNSQGGIWDPISPMELCPLRPLLDQYGNQIDDGVWASALVNPSIGDPYSTFTARLDNLQAAGIMNSWRALPYDWRRATDDVVEAFVDDVEQMANSSFTKKVTIIAHSMGGLVAKHLMIRLQQHGKASLVDRLILVASPQLGTPAAVSGLMHGDGLEIRKWGITWVDAARSKEASETMAGAYDLLPTETYFSRVASPLISFQPMGSAYNSLYAAFLATYQNPINSYGDDWNGLRGFLLGTDGRQDPYTGDCNHADADSTIVPTILDRRLMDHVRGGHLAIDAWNPPTVSTLRSQALGSPKQMRWFDTPSPHLQASLTNSSARFREMEQSLCRARRQWMRQHFT